MTKLKPTPLYRKVENPKAFPDFQNQILADTVDAISVLTQAPRPLVAMAVLAQVAIPVQPLADVQTLAGSSPISIFLLTIAESSERKSTCDRFASAPARNIHDERIRKYERDREAQIQKQERQRRGLSDDKVIEDVEDQDLDMNSEPMNPAIFVGDATMEGLLAHWENGNPSIGLVNDDAGQVFGGYSMRRENKLRTATILSHIWDGKTLDRVRAGTYFGSFPGRRVSASFMLQPEAARSVLADPELLDQGLLSRILVAYPESRIGLRTIDDPEHHHSQMRETERRLEPFSERVTELLERTLPTDPDDQRILRPRLLSLSKDARTLLVTFHNGVELEQKRDGVFEHIRSFASKIPEQACRIAGVLTLFADPDATEVSYDTMKEAIELAEWFLLEMQHLRASGWADRDTRDAERLREWLLKYHPGQKVSGRQLVRSGPQLANVAKRAHHLMAILEEHGWVQKLAKGTLVDGKKCKDVWQVIRDT